MITVGQESPSCVVDIVEITPEGESNVTPDQDLAQVFKSYKKVVLFAVPGAFTPTCSEQHLPGFVENAAAFREKGVDAVFCLSVNDLFVMKAWGKATPGFATSGIKLIADGNGEYARAIGLEIDITAHRLGMRCARFAAILENGVFKTLEVDSTGLDRSAAEAVLAQL